MRISTSIISPESAPHTSIQTARSTASPPARATAQPHAGARRLHCPPERSGSVYDKSREKASAGYYSVLLDDYRTQVEMSATTWTGIFRITFPASDKANILLDLGRHGGNAEIIGDHTLRGHTANGREYFVAEFSHPFQSFGTFKRYPPKSARDPLLGFDEVNPGDHDISGNFAGAYLRFSTADKQQVLVKIASGTSYEAAEARLHAEQSGWTSTRYIIRQKRPGRKNSMRSK